MVTYFGLMQSIHLFVTFEGYSSKLEIKVHMVIMD